VVGLGSERLQELWTHRESTARAAGSEGEPRSGERPLGNGRAATDGHRQGTRLSAGRGSLVRQAIARLVRFPSIAGSVSEAERAGLDTCEEPGLELLRALLDDLRVRPLAISAQVLERWADRSGGEHLGRLLEKEEILGDAHAAALELKAALAKLADQAAERRLEALEAKMRAAKLDERELKEFQVLMRRKAGRP
jgi:hypothetical protein